MSGYESRYFQYPDFRVVRVRGREQLREYEEDPAATEVQVVPVDAEVAILPTVERQGDYVVQPGTKFRVLADWADRTPRLDEEGLDDREAYHLRMAAVVRLTRKEREHPPVDEGMVQAVADLISEAVDSGISVNATDGSLERFLVGRGVRVEAKS